VHGTGTVAHDEIPSYLAAMDVAVVLAASDRTFHYSPLKLAEYLLAGLPVVAPRAGELPARLHDGVDAVLVEPGDPAALARALRRLRDDPDARARLGRGARAAADDWSWDRSAARVLAAASAARPTR
jgi:glycosyltransferase involved in cell wall biosynthesis